MSDTAKAARGRNIRGATSGPTYCMKRKESARERDERIVGDAYPWFQAWRSRESDNEALVCAGNVEPCSPGEERACKAAARILNRLSRGNTRRTK